MIRTVALTLTTLVLASLRGCPPPDSTTRYEVLLGTVVGLRAETGQLTVQTVESHPDGSKSRKISCLLTKTTEIYVNDRFSSFDAIAMGDTVRLVGHRDPEPQTERLVVSFANILRNEPLPPEPDLSPPTTRPTTQPQEN